MIVAHVFDMICIPSPQPSARVLRDSTHDVQSPAFSWARDNSRSTITALSSTHLDKFKLQPAKNFRFLFKGSFLLFLNIPALTACISVDVHTSGWIQETAVQHKCSSYWQGWPHEGNSYSTSPHIVGARGNVTVPNNHFTGLELVCSTLF